MSRANTSSEPLTRQACEPCRRKKTKCTAERPTCSFCQRLNTQCFYLPRGSAHASRVERQGSVNVARKTGKKSTKDRFRQLELQINDLYDLLGSSRRQVEAANEVESSFLDPGSESPARPSADFLDVHSQHTSPNDSCEFTLAKPEPPIEVLRYFVDVYRTKLHFQPLPLFRLEDLADQLLARPRYLLWSFLALLLTVSSHDFYGDKQLTARDFYARTADDVVMKQASDGVPTPDVTQSLCLIALRHIRTHQPARAWMAIGAASRLYALRALFRNNVSPVAGDDSVSRGYWSVFLLERLFLPSCPELSSADTPGYPDSVPLPPPPSSVTVTGALSDAQSSAAPAAAETPTRDIGVNEYCLRMVSTWGKTKSYLHRLRQGEVEKPWLSDSTHTKLSIELIEFEIQLCGQHLFNNVAFPKRTAEEISQHREYWNPWITTQIVWHAAQAILNHPFLHLVVLRPQVGNPQSCLFLQQKLDLALYHAGWVSRLIQTSEILLEIANPLIGDAVAATATVTWLYQFARDPKVAQKAQDDLGQCERFLNKMALAWPHILQKLSILRKLQALAGEKRPETTNQDTTISFKPTWFWDLLDPTIHQFPHHDSLELTSELASDPDARMCLRSHFVQPLRDQDSDQEQQPLELGPNSIDSFISPENFEQFHIEELSRGFLQDGFWN